jgi:hypothetical protein
VLLILGGLVSAVGIRNPDRVIPAAPVAPAPAH